MASTVIVCPWTHTRSSLPFSHTHTHTSLTVIVRPWTRIRLILLCFHTQPCLSSCVRGRAFAQVCYDSTHSLVCHRAPVDAHSLKFVMILHTALSVIVRPWTRIRSSLFCVHTQPCLSSCALTVIVCPWARIRLSLFCFHTQPCLSSCTRGHTFV